MSGFAGSWTRVAAVSALALTLAAALPPAEAFAQATPGTPAGASLRSLPLDEALRRAASADPARAGLEARSRAADAGVRQADVRPNPTLGLMVENLPTLGGGDILGRTETTLTYEQQIERGGDRPARVDLARGEGALIVATARVRQLDRLETVQRAWAEVLTAEAQLEIARERLALAERFQGEVQRRVNAARDPLFAGARAEAELAQAQIDFDQAEISVRVARISLAKFWDGAADFQAGPAAFEDTSASRVAAGEAAQADFDVFLAQRGIADARVRVEEARAIPDPTVSVGVRHIWDNDLSLVFGGSIPLQRHDRNQGAIDRARAEGTVYQADLEAFRIEREREIARLQVQLLARANEARRIAEEILPQAERAVVLVRGPARPGDPTMTPPLVSRRLIAVSLMALAVGVSACGQGAPAEKAEGETAAADYERGPHRGRMLRDGDFALEITIFEEGPEPLFRLYPYLKDKPLDPRQVQATIALTRLGPKVDRFTFIPTLMGWPADTVFTYEDRQNLIHPDDRNAVLDQSDATICEGADYHINHRVITPTGSTRCMEARGILIHDAEGQPLRIAGVTTDITERVRAERLRSALMELADALRDIADPDDLTHAACEITGRTLEVDRVGIGTVDRPTETVTIQRDWNAPGIRSIAGTLHFRDYGSYIEDLKRGETVVFDDARRDPRTKGTAAALEAISALAVVNMPLRDQGETVALFYANNASPRVWLDDELQFMRDVGERTLAARERRRAERHLAKLAASLERTVEQRTTELMASEAALRQAQKMEAVGQLTGGIAHDFNNLLTAISGSLEMVVKRIADGRIEDGKRFIAVAQAAAERASSLTHRLLAFSRRQTLEPKATDVLALARGIEDLIQRTVGPAIRLETVATDRPWPVLVDPSQLENALLNLCINARDAMPDGGDLTLSIANVTIADETVLGPECAVGDYVRLDVTDKGVGMSEETIARAFDPFFTTKPLGQGTGLGLSMIYGFVRQSSGEINIASCPGAGTNVCIHLPRFRGVIAPETFQDTDEHPQQQARRAMVVIVDDEAPIRMLAAEALAEAGFDFVSAEDGRSGLTLLNATPSAELLITDVGLPGGMNGRQLADAARANRPDLKVLFITGYAESAVLTGGDLEDGMSILTKPFELKALARRVTSILKAES